MFCSSNHSLFIVLGAKRGAAGDFRGGGVSQGSVRREDYGKLTVNKNRGASLEYYRILGGGGECDTRKGENTILLLSTTAITSASQ